MFLSCMELCRPCLRMGLEYPCTEPTLPEKASGHIPRRRTPRNVYLNYTDFENRNAVSSQDHYGDDCVLTNDQLCFDFVVAHSKGRTR